VQNYANEFRKTHIIPALNRGFFKTDDLVALTQKENISRTMFHLKHESRSLSAKPHEFHKIVNPSLFSFCFQRSRCLKGSIVDHHDCIDQCGKDQIADLPQSPEEQHIGSLRDRECYANDKAWSQQYQWLPFEVKFDENMISTQYACSINLPCPITV